MSYTTYLTLLSSILFLRVKGELYSFTPKMGCDPVVKVCNTQGCTSQKMHGNFIYLEMGSSLGNAFAITWPDLNKTFTIMPSLKQCMETEYEKPTQTVDYFEHRDEIDWNGQKCYKYYNDSSSYYVTDKDSLLLSYWVTGIGFSNYTDYSFSSIPASTFKMPEEHDMCVTKEVYQEPNQDMYAKECSALQVLPLFWLLALFLTFLLK